MKRFLAKKLNILFLLVILVIPCAGCAQGNFLSKHGVISDPGSEVVVYDSLEKVGEMELKYAKGFSVTYLKDGYARVTIDSDEYLIVPEGKDEPIDAPKGMIIIKQPLSNIYMVSTGVMDDFVKLGALDAISMSGTDASGYYIDEAKDAISSGDITYVGKYSAPDYEAIIEMECDLAIENTMIYHNPEVKENLESFGVPVLVEKSSYENEPLGRLEWIKLFGLITGKEDEANAFFDEQVIKASASAMPNSGRTVAFFAFNSNGTVTVRKTDDYVPKMIEYAGGEYIFTDLIDDSAMSTTTVDLERFYEAASDADILIYNAAIQDELAELSDLTDKWELFKDFKAVKSGAVYCTKKSMYQEVCKTADIIVDLSKVINSEDIVEDKELSFLYPLK